MNKKIALYISCIMAMCLSTLTLAGEAVKDAVEADPGRYTVEFENDKVRIIRIKYGPGEKSVMHSHGPNVAVMLSESLTRMTFADGTSVEETSEIGQAQWSDAAQHLPENVSDSPLEVVLIEIKE